MVPLLIALIALLATITTFRLNVIEKDELEKGKKAEILVRFNRPFIFAFITVTAIIIGQICEIESSLYNDIVSGILYPIAILFTMLSFYKIINFDDPTKGFSWFACIYNRFLKRK